MVQLDSATHVISNMLFVNINREPHTQERTAIVSVIKSESIRCVKMFHEWTQIISENPGYKISSLDSYREKLRWRGKRVILQMV